MHVKLGILRLHCKDVQQLSVSPNVSAAQLVKEACTTWVLGAVTLTMGVDIL